MRAVGTARPLQRKCQIRGWCVALLALAGMLGAGQAMASGPEPEARIPLSSLGYQTLMKQFLVAGSSMMTVDFVDKDHLLITFGLRRLMQREVDPPANDDDQVIGAFLVEVPSGKVLARTEWRMHDRLQYLWNLGHGHFLLRVRDKLAMLEPLRHENGEDAFRQNAIPETGRHIVAIRVSATGDLLTIVTTNRAAAVGEANDGYGGALSPGDSTPLRTSFYRLNVGGEGAGKLEWVSAGNIRSNIPILVPMTRAGFLDVLDGGKGTYLFNFDEHAGKVNELLAFDTTCQPRATFVGPGEFVVLGCRGSDERQDFAGFNLKGDQMWQQNFTDLHVTPTFSYAPERGRFALGRTLVSSMIDADSSLAPTSVTGQEVRVYQTYNGKLLFRIDCSPVERAGQNFALSPDGLRLAVIRETVVPHKATKDTDAYVERSANVEVYGLPPLSAKDEAAVREAMGMGPPDAGARIDVSLKRLSAGVKKAAPAAVPAETAGLTTEQGGAGTTPPDAAAERTDEGMGAGTPSGTAAPPSEVANEGDVEPQGERKPPTLYGPDEKRSGKQPR